MEEEWKWKWLRQTHRNRRKYVVHCSAIRQRTTLFFLLVFSFVTLQRPSVEFLNQIMYSMLQRILYSLNSHKCMNY